MPPTVTPIQTTPASKSLSSSPTSLLSTPITASQQVESALAPYTRHMTLFPLDTHMKTRFLIVGVGAIGSWVARFLVQSGAQHIQLVDPDVVSVENLSPQGYLARQIGAKKVIALSETLYEINPKLPAITVSPALFAPKALAPADVVFQCTDSMDARKDIFMWARENCKLFLDGRMAAEAMTLHSWYPGRKWDYRDSLFPQSEASIESCTARSTNYNAANAASILISFYVAWLKNRPLPHTYKMDFLTWTSEVENDKTWPKGSPTI